ncbi:cob(I)yrinic acid a,c-diamide adenosyltransferase [Ferrimicrobium acidiphilum]|jgi:cob(I)alamin adenosyltransferase|uniref:Cob(I)yrinic acid a,c-diamide adenosyltransferase n=1 Tax=Ferrimicrobium acidiphilum DSM 19497 TaxID=1121877 RepID=A0A0D8FXZ1_9ACTN|nr:cob(I)yrinic acid a,c-diamide adenosyltransferase [Ferrimicrobium acidiphilum]KJE78021.1 Cob(I)yrinic acid a,c-diamide adenosyltransferase [Ferrimicrobium acidiphilum DSM 19497]MCL5053213.1 cob(I)yrinic acid a,c-diamide adenosyltransferase [Gammaproteobacteria bacterium]
MERSSRLLINTGEGKGKSSAAFGVMSRGWARGWRVVVIQFVKGGKWKTGERKLADQLEIEFHTLGDGFTWESDDLTTTAHLGQEAWDLAKAKIDSNDYDLVILDELTYAITYGWIEETTVVETLRTRPARTNIVITGRGATEGLIEIADTVTEMRKVKHAYDQGIKAKKGIEY